MVRTLGILSAALVLVWAAGCGGNDQSPSGDDGGGSSGASSTGAGADDGGGSTGSSGSSGTGSGDSTSGDDATTSGSSGGADGSAGSSGGGADAGPYDPSVYQHHKNGNRDGVFIDPAFTKTAAATTHVLTTMGTVSQQVYAQPLYVENGPNGTPAFIVVTETNDVYAINAATGANLWHVGPDKIGTAATTTTDLPCGQIKPTLGITGTPYISNGVIYLDAMTVSGSAVKHLVHALKVADGTFVANWPVDVSAKVASFVSSSQNERGALQLVDGVLYVPYGGHDGDCPDKMGVYYHGWVVGIPVADPQHPTGWKTPANRGGIWGPGALPTDGTSVFPVTGNTLGAGTTWGGGEAVVRLTKGAVFSNMPKDYYAPKNWPDLDGSDTDLGGASNVVLDMPGAPKPHLIAAGGKDGNLYLLDRDNLGGIGGQLLLQSVAGAQIKGAMGAYTTAMGTYVVFHVEGGSGIGCAQPGNIVAVKITQAAKPDGGSPLTAKVTWCSAQGGLGSPMITTTDGTANPLVWAASNRLYAYDGDTGAVVVDGTKTQMSAGVQGWNVPIAASGHVAIGVSGALYLFSP